MPKAPLGTSPDTDRRPGSTTAAPTTGPGAGWRRWLRRAAHALWRLAGDEGGPPAHDAAAWQALARSAHQLGIAEQLAGLGSFDWHLASGALHWSEQHFRLWGLAPGSVVPDYDTFRRGVHPDDLAMLEGLLQQALNGGGHYDFQHRVRWPDGTLRHIHARGEVQFGVDGQALRMIGTVRDISAQRQAELQLHRFEHVVNSITDPISVVDEQMVYRLVNQAWSANLGLTPEQVVGRSVEALLGPALAIERRQALQRCLTDQQRQHVRSRFAVGHDQPRWWETTLFPYQALQDGARGAVVISRDVSAQQATQEALAASIDNLRLTLNATGDGIFASDARAGDDTLLFVNDRLLQIWHIDPDQATTLTPAGVMAAASRRFIEPQREVARIQEIINSGQPQEDRLLLNDGRVLLRRCVPTQALGRQVRVWSFRDITVEARALQSLREAEAQQRGLLEAFPGYIACIDHELRYTFVNERLAMLLGQPAGAIVGSRVRDITGPVRAAQIEPLVRRALAGETVQLERHHPATETLAEHQMLMTLAPVPARGGRPEDRLCCVFGTDISALKRSQIELMQARDEAERASRAKSAFLSSMSHELRTPMNAVLGFAQLLADDPTLGEHQHRQLGEVLRGGRHLLALINDLLDLAAIEAGRVQTRLAPVALPAVAHEGLALVAVAAQERGVQLQGPAPGPALQVQADATRLRQVLVNLLGNAVKYNRPGGTVRLGWQAQGLQVRVTVQDEGPGLTAPQIERLFQPFERLDAAQGSVEGSGIGLALSQRLVRQMGGEIGVQSQPGQGCAFWFTLARATPEAGDANDDAAAAVPTDGRPPTAPARDAAVPPAVPPAMPAGAPADRSTVPALTNAAAPPLRRVLYIEDNPVNAMLMEAVLDALPAVQTLCASTPEQGLALARSAAPHLVLVDIQLPGMDGFEVLRRLQAEPATQHLTVMAVSANAMPGEVARGRDAGFAAYLTKPLDVPELLRTVGQALASLGAEPPPPA